MRVVSEETDKFFDYNLIEAHNPKIVLHFIEIELYSLFIETVGSGGVIKNGSRSNYDQLA